MLNYLQHPLHGQKVESNEMIAAMDRASGWVDYDPSAIPPPWLQVKPDDPEAAKPKVKKQVSVVPDFLK